MLSSDDPDMSFSPTTFANHQPTNYGGKRKLSGSYSGGQSSSHLNDSDDFGDDGFDTEDEYDDSSDPDGGLDLGNNPSDPPGSRVKPYLCMYFKFLQNSLTNNSKIFGIHIINSFYTKILNY